MNENTFTVTLTFSQLWEIKNLLHAEVRGLTELYKDAEDAGYEDGEQIFKRRLAAVKDALDAVSEL